MAVTRSPYLGGSIGSSPFGRPSTLGSGFGTSPFARGTGFGSTLGSSPFTSGTGFGSTLGSSPFARTTGLGSGFGNSSSTNPFTSSGNRFGSNQGLYGSPLNSGSSSSGSGGLSRGPSLTDLINSGAVRSSSNPQQNQRSSPGDLSSLGLDEDTITEQLQEQAKAAQRANQTFRETMAAYFTEAQKNVFGNAYRGS